MLTQSQTDIANLALMQLGMRPIQNLADQNDANARTANLVWPLALGVLSRETPWNCLKKRLTLTQLAPAPDSPAGENIVVSGGSGGSGFSSGFSSGFGGSGGGGGGGNPLQWVPGNNYAVNAFAVFGSPAYLYQCMIANTAGQSFTQDLTKGYWIQMDRFSPNYLSNQFGNASRIYEWSFAYQLPDDFILLIELNGQNVFYDGGWNTFGSLYEIFQNVLYTDSPATVIKYNRLETDTTLYDTMFIDALVYKLAALMATTLRKDDATLSMRMTQMYQSVVTRARVKNGNEANARRYSVVSQSRFVGSRYHSTNG